MSFRNGLSQARFLPWQQKRRDLCSSGGFVTVDSLADANYGTCHAWANLVRQAILTGDEGAARKVTASLLESGYYEPGFIRICNLDAICQGGG